MQLLLQNEQQRLAVVQQIISGTSLNALNSPETIRAYGELLELASSRKFAIEKTQSLLSGLTASNVIRTPTVSELSAPSKKAITLIAGFMGGGLLALLWIFMRHAYSSVGKDPLHYQKWVKIKANLGLPPAVPESPWPCQNAHCQ